MNERYLSLLRVFRSSNVASVILSFRPALILGQISSLQPAPRFDFHVPHSLDTLFECIYVYSPTFTRFRPSS